MYRIFILVLGMFLLIGDICSQSTIDLKGKIVDEQNNPLIGATVYLYPIKKGAITEDNGNYKISNLPIGKYKIEVSYIGYRNIIDSIDLNKQSTYNFIMEIGGVNLHEVVVTDNYIKNRKQESSLNVEIVNDDYLKQHLGSSLMNSLERLPGVSTIDIGSGQSKPVIRGLGFNRVVVVENDIKHESQQWGADHGLEIDQYAVDDIEVIKGPASLMYGSDAIGGVIDMKNRKVPAEHTIGGTIDISGKSNNDFIGTSISLYGRSKAFFADFRATILDYADYKVPADSVDIYSYRAPLYKHHLRNTAGNEKNFHLTLGYLKDKLQSKLYLSNVDSKSGFFANAHGLEPRNIDTELYDSSNRDIDFPYQTVTHFKAINTTKYRWDKMDIETDIGFQRNFRQEWSQYTSHGYMPAVPDETLGFDPNLEREFDKYVYSGNLKLNYTPNDKYNFNFGFNSEYQDNKIDGRGFIIPAFTQLNLGTYAITKYTISDKSKFQAGLRYDFGNIKTKEYYDWFETPIVENGDTSYQYLQRAGSINRNFSNISWSIGYNYETNKWSFKTNIGKSFRMPIAKELAANGVNYHHFSYEIGNPDLNPEISYQLDESIEYTSNKIAIGISPFVNYFSNYIYLNPTSEYDRLYGNGNQIYYYTQSEVFRYGSEIHAHYELLKSLQLRLMGEYVYSVQLSGEKKGYTLPFSPPASGIIGLKYQINKQKFLENGYISCDLRITAAQNNIVPPEKTTDGYQIINLSLGGNLFIGKQKINVALQVQNLLNTKYYNHTSFYRLINVPEPGRNFILNISIPFSYKYK
ncbi:MAG: TonB-dependent receptor [Saprospiraceae bacterium]